MLKYSQYKQFSIKFVAGILFLLNYTFSRAQYCPQPLQIHTLGQNAYAYITCKDYGGEPYPSNSLYVVTPEGVVLIDTPWDSTQFRPLLDTIEARHHKKVVLCIATHFHADRTAGLTYYRSLGIPTYTSYSTWKLCAQRGEAQSAFYFLHDTVFTVGGYRFQTYYGGGGHTPDNIVVWVEPGSILYGGCLVKSTEATDLGNLADAVMSEYGRTIRRVIKKFPNPAWVIPGHLSWKSRRSLQHTLEMIRRKKSA